MFRVGVGDLGCGKVCTALGTDDSCLRSGGLKEKEK